MSIPPHRIVGTTTEMKGIRSPLLEGLKRQLVEHGVCVNSNPVRSRKSTASEKLPERPLGEPRTVLVKLGEATLLSDSGGTETKDLLGIETATLLPPDKFGK